MDATFVLQGLEKKILEKHYRWSLLSVGVYLLGYGVVLVLSHFVETSESVKWILGLYATLNILVQWREHIRMTQRMQKGVYGSTKYESTQLERELVLNQKRIGTPGPNNPWRKATRLLRLAKELEVTNYDLRALFKRRRRRKRIFRF